MYFLKRVSPFLFLAGLFFLNVDLNSNRITDATMTLKVYY